ncbi:MAG: hypothetical protein IT287_01865 [Bdellovibrionaceae bacterium]|nr:hypothetical protein [Pseudobdellovibrionaceae bacterium]
MISTRLFANTFSSTVFPEPEWKSHVERWYQLDAPSFMLCESFWKHKEHLQDPPDMVLLNSPHVSFMTDHMFCKTLSPSKFVHTLPSVRSSALFQLINWRGPLYSFVDTPENILKYGENLVQKSLSKNLWILQVEELPKLKVDWYVLKNTGVLT